MALQPTMKATTLLPAVNVMPEMKLVSTSNHSISTSTTNLTTPKDADKTGGIQLSSVHRKLDSFRTSLEDRFEKQDQLAQQHSQQLTLLQKQVQQLLELLPVVLQQQQKSNNNNVNNKLQKQHEEKEEDNQNHNLKQQRSLPVAGSGGGGGVPAAVNRRQLMRKSFSMNAANLRATMMAPAPGSGNSRRNLKNSRRNLLERQASCNSRISRKERIALIRQESLRDAAAGVGGGTEEEEDIISLQGGADEVEEEVQVSEEEPPTRPVPLIIRIPTPPSTSSSSSSESSTPVQSPQATRITPIRMTSFESCISNETNTNASTCYFSSSQQNDVDGDDYHGVQQQEEEVSDADADIEEDHEGEEEEEDDDDDEDDFYPENAPCCPTSPMKQRKSSKTSLGGFFARCDTHDLIKAHRTRLPSALMEIDDEDESTIQKLAESLTEVGLLDDDSSDSSSSSEDSDEKEAKLSEEDKDSRQKEFLSMSKADLAAVEDQPGDSHNGDDDDDRSAADDKTMDHGNNEDVAGDDTEQNNSFNGEPIDESLRLAELEQEASTPEHHDGEPPSLLDYPDMSRTDLAANRTAVLKCNASNRRYDAPQQKVRGRESISKFGEESFELPGLHNETVTTSGPSPSPRVSSFKVRTQNKTAAATAAVAAAPSPAVSSDKELIDWSKPSKKTVTEKEIRMKARPGIDRRGKLKKSASMNAANFGATTATTRRNIFLNRPNKNHSSFNDVKDSNNDDEDVDDEDGANSYISFTLRPRTTAPQKDKTTCDDSLSQSSVSRLEESLNSLVVNDDEIGDSSRLGDSSRTNNNNGQDNSFLERSSNNMYPVRQSHSKRRMSMTEFDLVKSLGSCTHTTPVERDLNKWKPLSLKHLNTMVDCPSCQKSRRSVFGGVGGTGKPCHNGRDHSPCRHDNHHTCSEIKTLAAPRPKSPRRSSSPMRLTDYSKSSVSQRYTSNAASQQKDSRCCNNETSSRPETSSAAAPTPTSPKRSSAPTRLTDYSKSSGSRSCASSIVSEFSNDSKISASHDCTDNEESDSESSHNSMRGNLKLSYGYASTMPPAPKNRRGSAELLEAIKVAKPKKKLSRSRSTDSSPKQNPSKNTSPKRGNNDKGSRSHNRHQRANSMSLLLGSVDAEGSSTSNINLDESGQSLTAAALATSSRQAHHQLDNSTTKTSGSSRILCNDSSRNLLGTGSSRRNMGVARSYSSSSQGFVTGSRVRKIENATQLGLTMGISRGTTKATLA